MCYMFIFLLSCKVFTFLGAWSNEYLRIVPTSHMLHGNNSYLFGGCYIKCHNYIGKCFLDMEFNN